MAINHRADPVHMVEHGHIAVVQNKQQQQHSSQQLQQIRMSVFVVYHVSLNAKIRFAPTAGLTPNKKPLEHTLPNNICDSKLRLPAKKVKKTAFDAACNEAR